MNEPITPDVSAHPPAGGAKILTIVGARPNFMKAAVLHRALSAYPHVISKIVHTGQHRDPAMSDVFFKELDLPSPDNFVGVKSDSSNALIAGIMLALEPVLEQEKPDWVVVIGDVNSTLAGALTAHKMGIPLAHVEAGLRSHDRTMPEENNRILTDAISDLLFITEPDGLLNLKNEGLLNKKIYHVGNCLIDTLVQFRGKAAETKQFEQLQLPDRGYALLTFHRPVNVDTPEALGRLVELVETVCAYYPAVFPVHPRTRKGLETARLLERLQANSNLLMPTPMGYLPFLNLMEHAAVVITDSGGVQVESSWLNIPGITMRDSVESKLTIELGSNVMLPTFDMEKLTEMLGQIQAGQWKQSTLSAVWDGKAAERMAAVLAGIG